MLQALTLRISKTGENKKGIFASVQRGVGGFAGYAKRSTGGVAAQSIQGAEIAGMKAAAAKATKNDVDENIIAISIKLERSEGGVRGEIRKMIIFRYLMGDDSETITDDMNLPLSYTKMIIII